MGVKMLAMELLAPVSCVPFYILAAVTLVCSMAMILMKNLVRGGFLLIGAFASVAGLYFILNANFVAISQILIYAVGITLVIVFAIMLTSLKIKPDEYEDVEQADGTGFKKFMAAISALGVFGVFAYVINSQDWGKIATISEASLVQGAIDEIAPRYTALIGKEMMQDYLLPFELISVLLLVIFVGAVILSKKELDQ